MRRLLSLVIACAMALLGLSAVAGPAAATGVVTGTVTDAGGHVLAGTVSAFPTDGSGAPGVSFTGGVVSATFPDGTYRLRITSSTLDGLTRWYVAGDQAGTTDQAAATVVTFPGPEVVVDLVFPEIAQVTGRVVGTDGQGVPGAYVLRNRLGSITQSTTDASGYYDFGHLRAGTVTLTAGKQGSHAQTSATYDVPASGTHVVPDIVVSRFSRVTGTVSAADGTPLAGVQVNAGNPDFRGSAISDATGRYTIEQLPASTFTLTFIDSCGDYAQDVGSVVVAEEGTGTADKVLVPNPVTPPAHVSAEGTVTMADGSSPRCVKVHTDSAEANVGLDGRWQLDSPVDETLVGAFASTDAQAWMPTYWPDAWTEVDATRVSLGPGTTVDGLDMVLHPAASITGTTNAQVGIGTFEVWTPAGERVAQGLIGSGGISGFDLRVRAGSWRVLLVGDEDTTFVPRWLGDAASLAAAPTWTVGPGQAVGSGHLVLPGSLAGVAPPVVSGTPTVGSVLSAGTGTWNLMTGTTFAHEWRRGSTVVGTGPTYVVSSADAGQPLTAVVTATNTPPGRIFTATQSSAPVTVAAAPTVTVPPPVAPAPPAASTTRLRATSPRAGVVRLVVTVRSSVRTDGTVTIRRGQRVVKRRVLLDASGRVVVRLRKQRPGRATYSVTYSGSPTTTVSSARVRLRVRG